jgi:protein TonB
MPEFATGQAAMFKYLSENIKYPAVARENAIEGTVYLGFIVDADGNITNVTVKRGVSGGCTEEAVRVVSGMPKWKPGKQQGRAVKVNFTLPVKFKLD